MRTKKENIVTKNVSITQFTSVLERMINKLMLNEGGIDKLEVVDDIRYFKSFNPKVVNYITKEIADISKDNENEIFRVSSDFVLLCTKTEVNELKYSRYNMFILYTSVYIYIYLNKENLSKDMVQEVFDYYFNYLNKKQL